MVNSLFRQVDDFMKEVSRWQTRWNITLRDQMLWYTFDAVDPVLYPPIDALLCILLTMQVASQCYHWEVVQRLIYIHLAMNVDLDNGMKEFVSAKTRRADIGQF